MQKIGHVCVCVCVSDIFLSFIYNGHFDCFCILVLSIMLSEHWIHISFWISVFLFFGSVPRGGISGPYGILFLIL